MPWKEGHLNQYRYLTQEDFLIGFVGSIVVGCNSGMLPGQVALLVLCDRRAYLTWMVTEGKEQVAKTLTSSLSPQSPWKCLGVQKIFVCYGCTGAFWTHVSANLGSWAHSEPGELTRSCRERVMAPERFTGLWKYVCISRRNRAWELGDLPRSPKLDPRAHRALKGCVHIP